MANMVTACWQNAQPAVKGSSCGLPAQLLANNRQAALNVLIEDAKFFELMRAVKPPALAGQSDVPQALETLISG